MNPEEELTLMFGRCIPLHEINERRIHMNEAQFYKWVYGNGFTVTRKKDKRGRSVAAVTKETARAILEEVKKQGVENPCIAEKVAEPPADHSNEPTTLAYKMMHPSIPVEEPRRTVKAEASWEREQGSGDMQFIDFSRD